MELPVTDLTKELITDCDSCLHRCVQGARMTLCVGVGEGVSDCTGRREGEKPQSFEGSGWFGKGEEWEVRLAG